MALGLTLLLLGCTSPPPAPPSGPPQAGALSPTWAEEAAGVWLRALRRRDPGMAWEMLSRASRSAYGDFSSFRTAAFPRLQEELGPWAWPGRGRISTLSPEDRRAMVILEDGEQAVALVLVWEDGDWKVESAGGPGLSLEGRTLRAGEGATIVLWVDGREVARGNGFLKVPPGSSGRLAAAWARDQKGASARAFLPRGLKG